VPEDQEGDSESDTDGVVAQAKHEAAEIVARAHRQAEAIIAEAGSSEAPPSPLAALGDNAEEIIGQVRKLIKKQRELQDERQAMLDEIEALKAERDELVQRLTDAVVRMEELSVLAEQAQASPSAGSAPEPPPFTPPPAPAPIPRPEPEPFDERTATDPAHDEAEPDDTSLAARLERAERAEKSSLAARLEQAQREERGQVEESAAEARFAETFTDDDPTPVVRADSRSFYDRHSAKLPRLEGDGGRSVLSAVGDLRPDPEPKGRKGRRRKRG
jgi:hypothetical protein